MPLIAQDVEYVETCEAWDAVVQEGRVYGRGDFCPGLTETNDPAWHDWVEHRLAFASLQVSGATTKAFGCASPSADRPLANCLPQIVQVLGGQGNCSGVLVAPSVVLTARHCADATVVATAQLNGTGLRVLPQARREVTKVVRHPDLDVALLSLDSRLPFDPLIWPVSPTPLPEMALIYGFGETFPGAGDFGSLQGTWFRADQILPCGGPVTARAGCGRREEFILMDTGRDSGPGDSGAPVVEPVGDGWRLIGVTSRSLLGGTTGEGGVYTRADAISAWLVSSIRRLTVP